MGTMIRQNFADENAPGFRKIFFDSFGRYPTEYPELYNMESMKVQYVDDSYTSSFGLIPKTNESAGVTFDEVIQGDDTRYTAETYRAAYRISLEMMEDGRYRTMKKLPAAFGTSMRITKDQDGANMLNNAFDTANFATGPFDKALLTLDHPLLGGGTQKNELTNAASLSEVSLNQAFIDLAATTDDRGKLMQLRPRLLVVHPAGEVNALKLLGSILEPDTANNAINPFKNKLKLSVNHFLTAAKAWYIQCDNHKAYWFDRIMPSHKLGNDFDTDDVKGKIRARWIRGWSMPWGWFGSPGV